MTQNRFLYFFLLLVLLSGCSTEQKHSAIVIGISSDTESLNPLYSFSGYEMAISELLYPSLVQHHWDVDKGVMASGPLLAESFEWAPDSSALKIFLRKDLYWSDGKGVTADDVEFSFGLFSDPLVQSRLYGVFKSFNTDEELKILPGSFKIDDPYIFTIIFRENAIPSLIDIDVPVMPAHIFSSIKRDEIIFDEKNMLPVVCGSFRLKSWNRNQSIILEKRSDSFLVNENTPDEIIFRVIPDYNARLTQLSNGEIDLIEDIRIDDIERLKKKENIKIDMIKGREYDYIGWNNIDPAVYSATGEIAPNHFFSNPEIRRSLTLAVNRDEMINEFLMNYGQIAYSPVSPIFTEAFNRNITPLEYSPSAAREILRKHDWIDRNNNGIVEKNGREFSFTLNIPSGNPRRELTALIIKNNLKLVGIDITIQPLEPSVFFEKLFRRELTAWIAGWSVPIPPELKLYWYSDLKAAPFNVMGFRNYDTDLLLDMLEYERNNEQRNMLMKEVQQIIYRENPVTFLFWIDNIVAYNKRIKNISITPLGAVHNIWEWQTDE
jgi:peptide/nickel transport system substrate-binding protein